ncbi:NifB/NifX family molybdenum-iron cluster-binding protein [Megalodesulfovibrio paquesii]
MRVCLATYGERLASLLETASELQFYESRAGELDSRGFVPMPKGGPIALAETLHSAGIRTLVCGAVSEHYAEHLHRAGIRLSPWIAGDVNRVLDHWLAGRLERLSMPGKRRK